MKNELYLIADELRAIANAGLRWTENGYDKERYERILKASARLVAAVEDGQQEDILAQYRHNLDHLSPVLCVESVVFREGKILLIQRSDDHKWAVPGGLLEVGESPAQGAERELWEETGLRGRAAHLLALYDTRIWPTRTRLQLVVAQFLMDADGEPGLHSGQVGETSSTQETLDLRFFAEDELPEMSYGHNFRIPFVFERMRSGSQITFFDKTELR